MCPPSALPQPKPLLQILKNFLKFYFLSTFKAIKKLKKSKKKMVRE